MNTRLKSTSWSEQVSRCKPRSLSKQGGGFQRLLFAAQRHNWPKGSRSPSNPSQSTPLPVPYAEQVNSSLSTGMRPRPRRDELPFLSQSPPQPRSEQDKMANSALEMLGLLLTLIGLIGVAASTGMPMWRVTAFIGENIIVFETRYEGLWMNCFKQADIRMQCKVYDSLLALPPDLQAARGLMCCSLALAGLALLISLAGLQCTACIRNNDRAKRLLLIVAGAMIFTACICVLIPVSWTAHVIIRDFYNPLLIDAQRRELGEALYIGWVAGAFLFAGGCVFTCCNVRSEGKDARGYVYSGNSDYMAYPPQPVRTLQPQQLVLLPQAQAQPVLSRHPSAQAQPILSRHPSAQAQPVLSRHPSTIYSYQSSQPSRYPSVRSGVAYL